MLKSAQKVVAAFAVAIVALIPLQVSAQDGDGPLRIVITEGVIEPTPFAIPTFVPENGGAEQVAANITEVVAADLVSSGLFREIPKSAHISAVSNFSAPVPFADWNAIKAKALITGAVSTSGNRVTVKFRLYDVVRQVPLGNGLQFSGTADSWRRMAHKVADQVYSRLTGESGYFDSKVAFVSETGPKNDRKKRLALIDHDGAGLIYLTDDQNLVLSPRFSPDNQQLLYTSFEGGRPQVYLLDINNLRRRAVANLPGLAFAPRFSPDGRNVVLSLSDGNNTDIYVVDLASGARIRLTDSPSIDTAPSYSPDGSQIVFESDRGGTQQIYVMSASGGDARRISFGQGRYGTPVWSPRGDTIAFTKMVGGRFHIGVMRTDGSQERLLTASFLDEAPTWAPNGRVLMFFRESQGASGAPQIYSVDITGRNLRRIPTPSFASDPAWSGLLP
ncbi:MAG TPA: Tol-Pal system beta propeller repeat protein TolB [Paracoccaceae bacterium]|nr:Tol-Pal system beta propeller repeat protein TolB [Paracoccaceae bacterium]